MQAVIALCHFCESHGPRVLLVTQMVPESVRRDYCIPSTSAALNTPFTLPEQFYARIVDEPHCAACTSFDNHSGLITDDTTARISYISTQVALNDRVYQLVKYSCLHSLSCEIPGKTRSQTKSLQMSSSSRKGLPVCIPSTSWDESFMIGSDNEAEREGVVLFGDDEHGYTLSQLFRLRDRKARGFLRLFSLIFICMDKLLITDKYDFFVCSMDSVASSLKRSAAAKFVSEQNDATNEYLKQANASRTSMLPAHFLRSRVSRIELDTSRSLSQITGCSKIFVKLHQHVTSILRAQTLLCKEKLLEGVPVQDVLVMKEREQNCTNFYALNSVDVSNSRCLNSIASLQQIAQMLEKLPKVLGVNVLDIVFSQVVNGGQIVLKCEDEAIANEFLLSLSALLPIGCVRLNYSTEYQHIFLSNLFGCPPTTVIPADAIDVVVLLLVFTQKNNRLAASSPYTDPQNDRYLSTSDGFISSPLSCPTRETNNKEIKINQFVGSSLEKSFDFSKSDLTLCSYSRCTAPIYDTPAIVYRYKQILLDKELSNRVLAAVVRNIRENWLSKAKLVYQLERQNKGIDLKKMLLITRCEEKDATVLLFFQAGLSKTYKQQVLEVISKWRKQSSSSHKLY